MATQAELELQIAELNVAIEKQLSGKAVKFIDTDGEKIEYQEGDPAMLRKRIASLKSELQAITTTDDLDDYSVDCYLDKNL